MTKSCYKIAANLLDRVPSSTNLIVPDNVFGFAYFTCVLHHEIIVIVILTFTAVYFPFSSHEL